MSPTRFPCPSKICVPCIRDDTKKKTELRRTSRSAFFSKAFFRATRPFQVLFLERKKLCVEKLSNHAMGPITGICKRLAAGGLLAGGASRTRPALSSAPALLPSCSPPPLLLSSPPALLPSCSPPLVLSCEGALLTCSLGVLQRVWVCRGATLCVKMRSHLRRTAWS